MQHAKFPVYDYIIIILTYHNMHVYPELEEWGAFLSAKDPTVVYIQAVIYYTCVTAYV